jgi:hypothetical protein
MVWSAAVKGLRSQANILGRIGTLGGIYDIDLDPVSGTLAALGPDLARGALVTVPTTFDRISITTRIARARLTAIDTISVEQLRRIDKIGPGVAEVELELEIGSTTSASAIRVVGTRDVSRDCEQLVRFGVGTLALESLRQCAADLGEPYAIADRVEAATPSWAFHFAHSNASDAARERTRTAAVGVARKLAATSPQLNLIDGMHDVLAKDRDSYTVVHLDAERTSLQLAVSWQHVRWETVVRMAIGFHPNSDVAEKLGQLAGAFDSEAATAVELLLGPREPPRMRVAASSPA